MPLPSQVPEVIDVPWCDTTAHFCYEAGHGYRCDSCMAVLGSMGMPRVCHERKRVHDAIREILGPNI